MDKIDELIARSEDELLQAIIDHQEGMLDQGGLLSGPSEANLAHWHYVLRRTNAPEQQSPKPTKRPRLRTVILVAILLAILIGSATGLVISNWIERQHEKFLQLQAEMPPADLVAGWVKVYVPEQIPEDYAISDAVCSDTLKFIEYANTAGDRIAFYQYSTDANIRIDTEDADKELLWSDSSGYLFFKEQTASLSWNNGIYTFSLEYDPAKVSQTDIEKMAQSIVWKT